MKLGNGGTQLSWLQKLMSLADDTVVYCAHEYTQANAAFALTVEPGNPDLVDRSEEIKRLRASNIPTVPTNTCTGMLCG